MPWKYTWGWVVRLTPLGRSVLEFEKILQPHHNHHSTVCLTTDLEPLPERVLQTAWSSASTSGFQYLLVSFRSSSSSLHLLCHLPIPFIFLSTFTWIMCFRIQCLCEVLGYTLLNNTVFNFYRWLFKLCPCECACESESTWISVMLTLCHIMKNHMHVCILYKLSWCCTNGQHLVYKICMNRIKSRISWYYIQF
jgi:hypothetical protein